MNLTSDAILYYADNPVDFVEDIIKGQAGQQSKAISQQRSKYPHDLRALRSRHREKRGGAGLLFGF